MGELYVCILSPQIIFTAYEALSLWNHSFPYIARKNPKSSIFPSVYVSYFHGKL